MGVCTTPSSFEAALRFLVKYYTPVGLQDVLAGADRYELPPRAVLVTFDDGYASVVRWAVPLCREFRVPAVFFLNAGFLDNRRLAPDNLVCYVFNALGLEVINAAARVVKSVDIPRLSCLTDVFSRLFPAISLVERRAFLEALADLGEIDETALAEKAGLYLTRKQVRELGSWGFELGNHTYTHVRCRSLDRSAFGQEIDRNKAELEALAGQRVRSFSVPYGCSADLTRDMIEHLELSGHQAVFLSESVANPPVLSPFHLDRVSVRADADDAFFFELEVLPRLRSIRNRFGPRTLRVRPLIDDCQTRNTEPN
ncbi:MAG TPA: polysaccharide deacetylase family protein [Candidatus Eisenbacteria bacterium]|nr:polysaccharide deacetylase family protein [Candidatus Eisenbacteria bacterium]